MTKSGIGEIVTGVSDELTYNETVGGYSKTVYLEQTDGHSCTSGIGFYIKGEQLQVYSSGEVIRVDLTESLRKELDTAKVVKY